MTRMVPDRLRVTAAARPQAMRQAPGAALVTALGTVTRPKKLAVALRALPI